MMAAAEDDEAGKDLLEPEFETGGGVAVEEASFLQQCAVDVLEVVGDEVPYQDASPGLG